MTTLLFTSSDPQYPDATIEANGTGKGTPNPYGNYLLIAIIGVLLLAWNYRSTPPEQQKELAHKIEQPHTAPPIKYTLGHFRWEITVREGQILSKLISPKNSIGDDDVDSRKYWTEKLDDDMTFIARVVRSGNQFNRENLEQINKWRLKEMFDVCNMYGLDFHVALSNSLGAQYKVYVVFLYDRERRPSLGFVIIPPGTEAFPFIVNHAKSIGQFLGGYVYLAGVNSNPYVLDYERFIEMAETEWWALYKRLKSQFRVLTVNSQFPAKLNQN